jgi:hypothetical protein
MWNGLKHVLYAIYTHAYNRYEYIQAYIHTYIHTTHIPTYPPTHTQVRTVISVLGSRNGQVCLQYCAGAICNFSRTKECKQMLVHAGVWVCVGVCVWVGG